MSIEGAASISSSIAKWKRLPATRPHSQLPFADGGKPLPLNVLYDTTVYVDVLQGKMSPRMEDALAAQNPWHSTVSESELIYLYGRLDPEHPNTAQVIRTIQEQIVRWPEARVLNPDRSTWRDAAILTGAIARLSRMKVEDRGRMMNDALIFLTAMKQECTVLTRNVRDFDVLQQLVPGGRVLFYRTN